MKYIIQNAPYGMRGLGVNGSPGGSCPGELSGGVVQGRDVLLGIY